jgi:hypothetical protein
MQWADYCGLDAERSGDIGGKKSCVLRGDVVGITGRAAERNASNTTGASLRAGVMSLFAVKE